MAEFHYPPEQGAERVLLASMLANGWILKKQEKNGLQPMADVRDQLSKA